MNAVNLYVTTCRYVLQSNPYDPESWCDLYRYLPYLRQALACCVCTNVLQTPMGPTDSICQHHVCKACVGGKMRLRPSCSWCKEYEHFQENVQLRIIVQCFKKLCQYLASSSIALNLSTTNGGTNSLMDIIQEGVSMRDNYTVTAACNAASLGLLPVSIPTEPKRDTSTSTENDSGGYCVGQGEGHSQSTQTTCARSRNGSGNQQTVRNNIDSESPDSRHMNKQTETPCKQEEHKNSREEHRTLHDINMINQTLSTVTAEHDYPKDSSMYCVTFTSEDAPKLKIRKTGGPEPTSPTGRKRSLQNLLDIPDTSDHSQSEEKRGKSKGSKKQKLKFGCRCGTATATPGKLTCCGQRCPCYSSYKGCTDCRCRGCRNPRRELNPAVQIMPNDMDSTDSEDSEIDIDV